MHHVPNLTLNDKLNQAAQAWAENLAKTNTFKHSKSKYGENIYYSWSSSRRPYANAAATVSWYS